MREVTKVRLGSVLTKVMADHEIESKVELHNKWFWVWWPAVTYLLRMTACQYRIPPPVWSHDLLWPVSLRVVQWLSSSFLFSLICVFVCQKAMTSNAMLWWSLLFTDVAQTEKQRTALDDCVVLWSLAPHLTQRHRTDYRPLARVTMQQSSRTKSTTLSIIMFNHTAIYF